MTTLITTSTTDSQVHNNIMVVGSRDHPPMLTTGPYKLSNVIILAKPTTDDSPTIPEHTVPETLVNISKENKAHLNADKEAIHLLLTGIGMKYTQPSLANSLHEMESQLSHTTLEWSRFVTIVKQTVDLDKESYHNLFDILKQYQKEVNEIRAKKIARNANLLALVTAAKQYPNPYYQAPKPQRSYAPTSKQSSSTRSQASTRYKGKEIAKPVTPPSKSSFEEDSDPEQAQKDKEMQKNLALIAKYFKKLYKPTNNNLRTSLNSRNKTVDTSLRCKNDNQSGQFGNQRTVTVAGVKETICSQVVQQTRIQCFNCKEYSHFAKECKKPKRVKDYMYHKEKMLLCKQTEKGVPLQADWLEDMDDEINEQELEAHYRFMAKIQEVLPADSKNDVKPLEQVDSNVIPNSSNMCTNDDQIDQNAKACDDECVALANLIANLKLDVDENKKIHKAMGETTSSQDSCLIALQNKQTELEKYIALNDWTVDYEKLQSNFKGLLKEKSKVISDLKVKEGKYIDKMIAMDKQLKFLNKIVYKRNQSIQTIHMLAPKCSIYNDRPTFANPMYLKKAQSEKPCLNEIPYDNSDLANRFAPNWEEILTLEQECRSKLNKDLVKPYDYTKQNSLYEIFKPPSQEHLQKLACANEIRAHTELQCLYLHKVKECEYLALKFSKQTDTKEVHNKLLKSFSKLEQHSISLELALQQCQEQMKNDTVCKENASNVFQKEREQYLEIQDLKAQLQDKNIAISELKNPLRNAKENVWKLSLINHLLFDNQMLNGFQNHQF
ncbi:retrovirus-related pol polyprotein from transposon TNT 1-94 [Tanacetum coccineum]